MIIGRNLFRVSGLAFGAVLALGAGTAVFGQGGHTHGGNGNHQKQEKRAEKRHQKADKEALKQHQREERDYYGNDSATRDHQRQEREQEKYHRRNEEQQRKAHQRNERNGGGYDDGYYDNNGGYNGNDGYYGNGGNSSNQQAVFDRGYQEGVRAGRDDRARNRQYNYEDHRAYRNTSSGNRDGYGDTGAYREGFRRGYDEGYRNGSNRRNSSIGIGSILGGILGRP